MSDTGRFDFSCIGLVGLGHSNLMDAVRLRELRDFEVVPSGRKQEDIPITYIYGS